DLDFVPRAAVVDVADAETSATLEYLWSRRWSSEFRASFGISGGADAAAQAMLPRQRITELEASLDHRLTPRDTLSTGLTVAQIWTSNGYDHWLATAMETWATDITPASG